MNIETIKLNFIQELLKVSNEEIIAKLESILKKARLKEKTVGFTAEGKPMNKEAYIPDLDEARSQIKEGKFVSQEKLEKQSENWQKVKN